MRAEQREGWQALRAGPWQLLPAAEGRTGVSVHVCVREMFT